MVNTDSTLQQLGQRHHLRQLSIGTLQPRDTLGDEVVDVPLLHVGRQVEAGERVGVGVASCPGEGESNNRKLVLELLWRVNTLLIFIVLLCL